MDQDPVSWRGRLDMVTGGLVVLLVLLVTDI